MKAMQKRGAFSPPGPKTLSFRSLSEPRVGQKVPGLPATVLWGVVSTEAHTFTPVYELLRSLFRILGSKSSMLG